MIAPIPPEKAEQLIYFYVKLHYKWQMGADNVKITNTIAAEAQRLGMCSSMAWALFSHARKIGMIED